MNDNLSVDSYFNTSHWKVFITWALITLLLLCVEKWFNSLLSIISCTSWSLEKNKVVIWNSGAVVGQHCLVGGQLGVVGQWLPSDIMLAAPAVFSVVLCWELTSSCFGLWHPSVKYSLCVLVDVLPKQFAHSLVNRSAGTSGLH